MNSRTGKSPEAIGSSGLGAGGDRLVRAWSRFEREARCHSPGLGGWFVFRSISEPERSWIFHLAPNTIQGAGAKFHRHEGFLRERAFE